MRFVDEAVIRVEAGAGGDGCVSFRREKYVPRGGPNGGDGGDGGSVVLVGRGTLQTLADLEYHRFYRAGRGGHGRGSNCHGRNGDDAEIAVPLGTDAFDGASGEKLGEILADGQRLIVARGGNGGRGNARFATSVNQAPRIADEGKPGEARDLKLVLRMIADVGFVGLPNAGKSTLLAALTRANPKIAGYPFTTLTPNLGVMTTRDYRFTLADMPGIIEGAHSGKGLGLAFLRHIERTRMLVFVIDASGPTVKQDYAQLCSEVRQYDPAILERPRVIALNKADLLSRRPRWRWDAPALFLSALNRTGVDELRAAIDRSFPK